MKLPVIPQLMGVFARMSKRERLVLYATALIIGGLFMDQVVISPIIATFKNLDQDRNDLEREITETMAVLSRQDQINKEFEKLQEYLITAKSEEEEVRALLERIEELASSANVNLMYVKPAGAETKGRTQEYLISLECEGRTAQLINFFYQIESSKRLLRIDRFDMQPTTEGSSIIKASARISRSAIM